MVTSYLHGIGEVVVENVSGIDDCEGLSWPCLGRGSCCKLAPKDSAMAWWPRHTPRMS